MLRGWSFRVELLVQRARLRQLADCLHYPSDATAALSPVGREVYKRFQDIDTDKSGAIEYEEFMQVGFSRGHACVRARYLASDARDIARAIGVHGWCAVRLLVCIPASLQRSCPTHLK